MPRLSRVRGPGCGRSTTATQLVGFVMISDGIEELDDDLVGPYYLWRLLIDERFQGRGYGRATIDAVVRYLATRPGAEVAVHELRGRRGSPQGFYLRYGFEFDRRDQVGRGPAPPRPSGSAAGGLAERNQASARAGVAVMPVPRGRVASIEPTSTSPKPTSIAGVSVSPRTSTPSTAATAGLT